MRQIVLPMLSQLFSRSEVNLKKHLTTPRDPLFDLERQLARRIRAQFREMRRAS